MERPSNWFKFGENHINWKGGRVKHRVKDKEYYMILLPEGHHLCIIHRYGYLHRVVAERILDRKLTIKEVVGFADGNTLNCSPENILIFPTFKHFRAFHRKLIRPKDKALRGPDESNPVVNCACGCGASFNKFDRAGRPRMFISGHNNYAKLRCL